MKYKIYLFLVLVKNWIALFIKKTLIKPPDPFSHYYPINILSEKLNLFNIKKLLVLIDDETAIDKIPVFNAVKIIGYYSLSLNLIDKKINNHVVQPLIPETINTSGEGWLIYATNKHAVSALNNFLLENDLENQIIIQGFKSETGTQYYSNIDFFHNDQQTKVIIHNYLEHCYKLPFPINILYTLRTYTGEIIKTGQLIIPPNGIKTIESASFQINNFKGYLEIEFDISYKTQSFLHYNALYISEDYISSNHQSGLGLHPAGSKFARGYIPEDENSELVLNLFQRNYDEPIITKGILYYTESNQRKITEKGLPPIHKHQINYINIKEYFNELDFSKIEAPLLHVTTPVPLHRPNFLYTKKGKKGLFDINHSANETKIFKTIITPEEHLKLKKYNYNSYQTGCLIFPPETGIETLFALWNNEQSKQNKFLFEFYDSEGCLKYSCTDHLDENKKTYLNLNEYLNKKGIKPFAGSFKLSSLDSKNIPLELFANVAYKSERSFTSTATGLAYTNIPFHYRFRPGGFWGEGLTNLTDIYAPALNTDEFETYILIECSTAAKTPPRKSVDYSIEIYNTDGNGTIINKTIPYQGSRFIKTSELIKEQNNYSSDGTYCVWIKSSQAYLFAYWFIYRKRDGAISVEHFYAGKFN